MEFGQVLKSIRINMLLSQEAFAKELGVSFSTVNRWESGKVKPRYRAMKKISDFCETHGITFEVRENYLR